MDKDKPWIKGVLIVTFILSLAYVFWNAHRALRDPEKLDIAVEFPKPPTLVAKPTLPLNATTEQYDVYLKQAQDAAALDTKAVETYVQHVTIYGKEVEARIAAAKAKTGDTSGRLTAFEKVIKDTLGPLIVAPLLAALLIYSGIKVGGDVGIARATEGKEKSVKAP